VKFTLATPRNFNLWSTVFSHGWCSLPPFSVDQANKSFGMVVETASNKFVPINITKSALSKLEITIPSKSKISSSEKNKIEKTIRACLRLDEDYSAFYAEVKRYQNFSWVLKLGAGRLLRAPTVFEDAVKMMCTTNCSWGLTEAMVNNLCSKLGTRISENMYTFPSPEALADCTENYIRKEIRAGYRSPYLLELSRRIVKGEINIESWRSSEIPSKELYEEVRSVKGLGPYAAGNILKLLGRYDYLAIDSWCRKQFLEIHGKKKASDKIIEKYYQQFGEWKGLFFWLELTKPWYDKQFPF
jgi:3-methyladenine DNA glycosylase/8-oxoguanine DNA glycosylase